MRNAKTDTIVLGAAATTALAALAALAGCRSTPPADRLLYRTSETPAPALYPEHWAPPPPAPPANDIPERRRIEWYERREHRVAPPPVPLDVPPPERRVVRERVVYRTAPVREVYRVEPAWWYPSVSFGLGWWGGRHHRTRWGVGLGWGWPGWGWGWGWGWGGHWGGWRSPGWCW